MVIKESSVGAVQGPVDPHNVVHIGELTSADPYGLFFVRYRCDVASTGTCLCPMCLIPHVLNRLLPKYLRYADAGQLWVLWLGSACMFPVTKV